MAEQWFFESDGGRAGPVDTAELKRLLAAGTVRPTTIVWRTGLAEWTPASQMNELFDNGAGPGASGPAGGPPAPAAPAPPPHVGHGAPSPVLPYLGGGVPVGITPRTVELLRQTRPWVMFFGVLGFVAAGLYALGGVWMMATTGLSARSSVPGTMGLLYVLVALVFFFPALMLWRYGSRIGDMMVRGHVQDLEAALEAQKGYWRLTGIITIGSIVAVVVLVAGLSLSNM